MRMLEPLKDNHRKSSGEISRNPGLVADYDQGTLSFKPWTQHNSSHLYNLARMASILLRTECMFNRFSEHGETRIQLGKASLPKDVISSAL